MTLHVWLASSLDRQFPHTPSPEPQPLTLHGALNERRSFQVVVRLEDEERQGVRLIVDGPSGWPLRVRRVGYVPVRHHNPPVDEDTDALDQIPGYVPDPLFDDDDHFLPSGETHAFWVTIQPGTETPGDYEVAVRVEPERGEPISRVAKVCLHDVVLAPRRNFHVTQWIYVDALIDWYQTDLFDQRFWEVLQPYVEDLVAHGQDTLYVPVFTPPLDGVKRPSQLLDVRRIGPDTYRFNWRDVKRYVDLAKASGITHFEWCHLFTQWGAREAIRVYQGQGKDEQLLWPPETAATSDIYRTFLSQYLPELHRFLEHEDILHHSFFHLSDEPHVEQLPQYREDREMLRELAPWMDVMDALTDIGFAREGVTDMPVPSIRTALNFVTEGIPSWCYYCCGPRGPYLNRLMDTPLAKIAMHGFLFYRWPLQGFLHWGYNYWYESQTRNLIDPYTVQEGRAWWRGWAYGDPFQVYPGHDGPVDSLRWEVFGESLQDYRLLQTLDLSRADPLLASIRSFADFPKTPAWREGVRAELFARAEGTPAE
ncbi:MAG: DUF4091 domain-containing protein [Anaerolineae bacterium]